LSSRVQLPVSSRAVPNSCFASQKYHRSRSHLYCTRRRIDLDECAVLDHVVPGLIVSTSGGDLRRNTHFTEVLSHLITNSELVIILVQTDRLFGILSGLGTDLRRPQVSNGFVLIQDLEGISFRLEDDTCRESAEFTLAHISS
jgi:hypothetical protein